MNHLKELRFDDGLAFDFEIEIRHKVLEILPGETGLIIPALK